jgi:dTMP kinase
VFITFEGGEGAGKSTQLRRLAETLRARGFSVVTTREPGGTPTAERIRKLLLEREGVSFDVVTEALLFAAARHDHVATLIEPALQAGQIVLCDRFFDSTTVYQGLAGSAPHAMLRELTSIAVGDTRPDLTLILDLAPEAGLARARQRQQTHAENADHFEERTLAFHVAVRRGFRALAEQEPQRCRLINAEQPAEVVAKDILGAVASLHQLAPALA